MGMDFEIQKPDGSRKYVTMMSYGSFGIVSHIGRIAGFDMEEYDRITDYSGLDEEWVVPLEDVRKILLFYQKLLDLIEELDRRGIILLTETEKQQRHRELKGFATTPRDRWEGAKSSLHQLIDLCERAIKVGGSIVMVI